MSDILGLDRKEKENTISTYTSISGLSLRRFPSDSSGFFFGLGGGVISVNQEVKQSRKYGKKICGRIL